MRIPTLATQSYPTLKPALTLQTTPAFESAFGVYTSVETRTGSQLPPPGGFRVVCCTELARFACETPPPARGGTHASDVTRPPRMRNTRGVRESNTRLEQ